MVLLPVRFLDSHLHLSDYPEPRQVVQSSVRNGLLMFAVSVDEKSSSRNLALAKGNNEWVRAFVGVHPSEAGKVGDIEWLEDRLREATGLGEVGLDPKYSVTGRGSRQSQVFEAQLTAAERRGKPVQVHARGTESACLGALARFKLPGVLLHWFEGEEHAKEVQGRGYFVSFGPALIYSRKLQRAAASIERNLVLTETDGPVPFRPFGGAEGPLLVPSVVFRLSQIWSTSFEEAADTVFLNGLRYLGVSGKG